MRIIPLILPFIVLAACGSAQSNSPKVDGPKASRSFDLSGFEGVALRGSDDVRVTQGSAFSVKASGSPKVLAMLELEVKDGILIVKRKDNGWSGNWSNDRGALIEVTLPVIRSAVLAGSGDLLIDGTADDRFKAVLAGSGDLKLANFAANDGDFSIAGSGDMEVAGNGKSAIVSIAGSGDFNAERLQTETVTVSIAGSGNASSHASKSAKVSLIGSGDVRITGTRDCTISKMGSGDVTCG